MPVIQLTTSVEAPVERVFDLARSVDLHMASTTGTKEQAIAGRTTGLMEFGEEVTWRGRHFGLWQTLTVRITAMERPNYFSDSMVRGAFRRMDHQHYFAESSGGTLMRDVFSYQSPLGVLGWIADRLFLERHMRGFLLERNRILKATAESDLWERYIKE